MKRRKLTPFLAREMLYEFATDQLDADRKAAVEEFLKSDREAQTILADIEASLQYAKTLSSTEIQGEILAHLKEAESALSLGKKYSSWAEWPEALRWSLTAIGLSALVAGIVAVVPWQRFSTKSHTQAKTGLETIEVAQIPQPTAEDLEAQSIAESEGSGDEPPEDAAEEGSGDEHEEGGAAAAVAVALAPTPAPTPVSTPVPSPSPSPLVASVASTTPEMEPALRPAEAQGPHVHFTPYFLARKNPFPLFIVSLNFIPAHVVPPRPERVEPGQKDESKPADQILAKQGGPSPSPQPAKPVAVAGSTARNQGPDSDEETTQPNEKARGFVYRAFMSLQDLEELSPQITDDLLSLGAEKAGEVELGWKRGTGRYYHFAMPEENEKKVLEKLQVYGPVRISKDPHPRIMPKGQVRFILWVDSAN